MIEQEARKARSILSDLPPTIGDFTAELQKPAMDLAVKIVEVHKAAKSLGLEYSSIHELNEKFPPYLKAEKECPNNKLYINNT